MSRVAGVTRRIAIISGALTVAMLCSAHVGSPDVFWEGAAGAYPVRVIIRSPDVIPARAEITVRVTGSGVKRVTATTRAWSGNDAGAPPPDDAVRVAGDSTLWTLQLWMMRQGPYAVLVNVEGSAGGGTATVPYTAVAQRVLKMDPREGIALSLAGIFLITGLLTIINLAAGEATVFPGEPPSDVVRARGRRARWVGAALIVAILVGGRLWWNYEDGVYALDVFRPAAAKVSVRDDTAARNARPTRPGRVEAHARILRVAISRYQFDQRKWLPLIPDHGKLMHLFLVRKDGLGAIAHLHPVMLDSVTFESALPSLAAGAYYVFADVVHENGFAETLREIVTLDTAPGLAWKQSDGDDAVFLGSGAGTPWRFDDGSTLSFDGASAKHAAKADAGLRFTLRDPSGKLLNVEPYMGMAAHAVIVRDDGKVFEHLHPMGNTPAIDTPSAMGSMTSSFPGVIEFPWAFPSAGRYRVWVQFRVSKSIRTAAFDVVVGS